MGTFFFIGCEHYYHKNCIIYDNRPFDSVDEMNNELIKRNNEIVTNYDRVIHVGDFTLAGVGPAQEIIRQLNGQHTFLIGNHDAWLKNKGRDIWQKRIEGQVVVACHYPLRTWNASHYGSWQVFSHPHGKLNPVGKQWDVSAANNNFYPVSFEKLKSIMNTLENNNDIIQK
jgi:calcineurin-like phosphoesterase family protein